MHRQIRRRRSAALTCGRCRWAEGVCEGIDAKRCCCSAGCLGPVYETHGYEDADPVKCHFAKVSDVNFIMAEVTHIERYGCRICR